MHRNHQINERSGKERPGPVINIAVVLRQKENAAEDKDDAPQQIEHGVDKLPAEVFGTRRFLAEKVVLTWSIGKQMWHNGNCSRTCRKPGIESTAEYGYFGRKSENEDALNPEQAPA